MTIENFENVFLYGTIKEYNNKFNYLYRLTFVSPDEDDNLNTLTTISNLDKDSIREHYPNVEFAETMTEPDSIMFEVTSI